MRGIDVSTLQGYIDWKRVKASGVDFAMIKASQGRGEGASTRNLRLFEDSAFQRNIVGAYNAGLLVGAYHYLTAQTVAEAREEAAYFCRIVEPHKNRIRLWLAADVESTMYMTKLRPDVLTSVTAYFLAEVRDRLGGVGRGIMLYTNPDFLTYRYQPGAWDDMPIWLADYRKKPQIPQSARIHQYGVGRVGGIYADVDLDVMLP